MLIRLCAATMALGIGLTCLANLSQAQETRFSLGSASSNRLQEDLKALVDMAPPNLAKQWQTLKDVLDSFVEGVNTDQPMALDLLLGGKELHYVLKVPVTKMAGRGGFVNNVQAFGFKVTGPDPTGLYTIEQVRAAPRGPRGRRPAPAAAAAPPAQPFFMREAFGHALIAPRKDLLPANVPDPAVALKTMLTGETDIAATLKNDAAGMAAKRASFQELRKQLEAALEFRRGESPEELALRKLAQRQNLNEAERFLVESDRLEARWTTDGVAGTGAGKLLLTALSGTALETSIQQLTQKSSLFANVKFAPKPALQLRVNFPADEMRSQHAVDLYAAMLPVLQAEMDRRPNLNATGKATAKDAIGKLFAMLNQSVPLKVLDGFIDVHAVGGGKHVGLCGIHAVDGFKATEILALFPKIREGWTFKENIAEHGGVKIHALGVAPHRKEEFQSVFGGELVVYIGVSKDVVWGAAGEGSLEALKAAIDQAAGPAPSTVAPEFVELEMRFEPWVRVLDAMRAKEGPSKSTDPEQIEFEKQRDKARKFALETMAAGDDILKAVLRHEQDQVTGTLEVNKGIFRFLGTGLADFTAENLR